VTDDGAATDLDLGHYDASPGPATKADNITTGRIYQDIITKDAAAIIRPTDTGGAARHQRDQGFVLIGNENTISCCRDRRTVGDIEGLPFFERSASSKRIAARPRRLHSLTLLPFIPSAGELKTKKPTQHRSRSCVP